MYCLQTWESTCFAISFQTFNLAGIESVYDDDVRIEASACCTILVVPACDVTIADAAAHAGAAMN